METLKNIFVSYEIAKNLKEIGFDEPCIAYRTHDSVGLCTHTVVDLMVDENTQYFDPVGGLNSIKRDIMQIPTYEQVFSWFRKKNYQSSIVFNFGSFYGYIEHTREAEAFTTDEDYNSYEEARKQLILKLISIYKNDKK